MVKKIFLLVIALYSLSIQSQTSNTSLKILEEIHLNYISFEERIFLNKNDFEISFKKEDVINELIKIKTKQKPSSPSVRIIEEFILLNELNNNINLDVCDDQFKLIFNDIACELIQRGKICLNKNCVKIFNILRVEFFESNAFFGEKTIRFITRDNKDFWTCELLLSEDYVW